MKLRTFLILTAVVVVGGSTGLVKLTSIAEGEGSGRVQATPTSEELDLGAALEEDVRQLALHIGERSPRRPGGLRASVDYLGARIEGLGYEPVYDGWATQGHTATNIEVTITGSAQRNEVVVLGAHYDSYRNSPCADATASGTATLLHLLDRLRGQTLNRTLKVVFLVNGERPVNRTKEWGAARCAERAKANGENVVAMVALGPFGFFTSAPDSQGFPPPWNLFWPHTGDFVSISGNLGSRELVRQAAEIWKQTNELPVVAGVAPSWVPGMQAGDHDAFQEAGVPSILVSDTGSSRFDDIRSVYDQYHRLDYKTMARAVLELEDFVVALLRNL